MSEHSFSLTPPVNIQKVLQCYIELNSPASRNQIKILSLYKTDEKDKAALEAAVVDDSWDGNHEQTCYDVRSPHQISDRETTNRNVP